MRYGRRIRKAKPIVKYGHELKATRQGGPIGLSLPAEVIRQQPDLSDTAWQVLIGLQLWYQLWDSCTPRRSEVARLLRVSEDVVYRGLRELEQRGYLHRCRQDRGPDGLTRAAKLLLLSSPYPDRRQAGRCSLREELRATGQEALAAQISDRGEGPPYARVPFQVLHRPDGMPLPAWRTLLGLYAYWQRHRYCCPSYQTLASYLGCSPYVVNRGLTWLRRHDYVCSKRRYNNSSLHRRGDALLTLERAPMPDWSLLAAGASEPETVKPMPWAEEWTERLTRNIGTDLQQEGSDSLAISLARLARGDFDIYLGVSADSKSRDSDT
jgi:hypothetical protein